MSDLQEITRNSNSHYRTTYSAQISTPRTSAWNVNLWFAGNASERLAEADGRVAPSVEVARNSVSGRHGSWSHPRNVLPKALQPILDELIEKVTADEHAHMTKKGITPVPRSQYDVFADRGVHIPVKNVVRACELLEGLRPLGAMTDDMVAHAAELAKTTVWVGEHEDALEEAEDEKSDLRQEISEANDKLDDLAVETEKAQSNTAKARAVADAFDQIIDRLKNKDLGGAYGADDFEKILDLLEPTAPLLAEIF